MKLRDNLKFLALLNENGLTYEEFVFYVNIIKARRSKNSSNSIAIVGKTEKKKKSLEESPQQPYYSSYGTKTTYSTPSPFVSPTKTALLNLWNDVKNLDQFLIQELHYKNLAELNQSLSEVQKDAVGLWIRNSRMA